MPRLLNGIFIVLMSVAAVLPLLANDNEATAKYDAGRKLYIERSYRDAAKCFEESYTLADSPAIKANSLLAQIGAYRMCGLLYNEFNAIELLLEKYMEYADYKVLVEREFEIGDAFHRGQRDPAFWSLRWVPWLTGPDYTEEIYSKALKRSPYSARAPRALLFLAHWYEMEGKTYQSLDALRTLVKDHPHAKECKYALLALGNGLLEIARHGGDGDGVMVAEALKCFNEFSRRYPGSPEFNFAKRKVAQSRDIQAKRLCEMAEYYRKSGRSEVAAKYMAKVVQNFPDSEAAPKAEKELAILDKSYLPGDFSPAPEARLMPINAYTIPEDAENELISPLKSGSPFLLPVPDLKVTNSSTSGE